jgi:hypothetical protein
MATFIPAIDRRGATWLAARLAWATMLALHIPAVLGVIQSVAHGATAAHRLIPLGLSVLFFGLKIVDTPWLRLRLTRRQMMACATIAALLHAESLTRIDAGALLDAPFPAAVLTTGLVAAVELLRRLYVRVNRGDAITRVPASRPAHERRSDTRQRLPRFLVERCLGVPRAPPL